MASSLYAFGLQLIECIGLRLKDVDVASHHIVVKDGVGAKTGQLCCFYISKLACSAMGMMCKRA